MKRRTFLTTAIVLIALTGLPLAVTARQGPLPDVDGPSQQQPRSTSSSGGGGGIGIGISFNLGKKKKTPKVETMDMRDVAIDPAVANQAIFVIAGGEAEGARIARGARVTLLEVAPLDAIGKTMVVVDLGPGDNSAALDRLGNQRGVLWVQPNHQFQPLGKTLPRRFTLHGVTSAAQLRVSGSIAMIDTPIELGNAALKGAAIEQRVFGTSARPAAHGTAIAALLVGAGEVAGMAQGARLISLAAFDPDATASGISQTRYIAKAMNEASRIRPDVLNLSFGGREDRLLGELLDAIGAKGICVTAAAGNGGPQSPVLFPARHRVPLAVTASDERMKGYAFAARGSEIDVTGIGVGLLASVPGGYRQVSGTSFATAVISGALLRLNACTVAHDLAEMRRQVAANAQDMGVPGPDPVFGLGLLRLATGKPKAKK